MRYGTLILLALLFALPAHADLVTGTTPGQKCRYRPTGDNKGHACWELFAITNVGVTTEVIAPVPSQPGRSDCFIKWINVQTNCTPPNPVTCSESHQGTTGPPAVWTSIGALTDPASGVSELPLVHPPDSYVKCVMTDLADADCTDLALGLSCAVP